jgi:hypothetical protein
MGRRTFTAEQIIGKLRLEEVFLSQGDSVGKASRRSASPSRPTTVGAKSMVAWV